MTFSYMTLCVCSCPVSLHSLHVWVLSCLLGLLLMGMLVPSEQGSCLSGLLMFTNLCMPGTHSQSIFAEWMWRQWTFDVSGLSSQERRNKSLLLAKAIWIMRLLGLPSSYPFSVEAQVLHFFIACVLVEYELTVSTHRRHAVVWKCTWELSSAMNVLLENQEHRDMQRSSSVQLLIQTWNLVQPSHKPQPAFEYQ